VTRDFKRLLAYSSIEHMGILSIGAAIGGAGLWAALFHLWSNAVTKGSLFLSAGNLRRAGGGGRTVDEVRGMATLTPHSATLFIAGLFAVTACPPFGPFFSELRMFEAAMAKGHGAAIGLVLLCLLLAFAGIIRLAFEVVDGRPRLAARREIARLGETRGVIGPPLVLLIASVAIGMFPPEMLREAWWEAAAQLESGTPIVHAPSAPPDGWSIDRHEEPVRFPENERPLTTLTDPLAVGTDSSRTIFPMIRPDPVSLP